jgi:hypothetical protein
MGLMRFVKNYFAAKIFNNMPVYTGIQMFPQTNFAVGTVWVNGERAAVFAMHTICQEFLSDATKEINAVMKRLYDRKLLNPTPITAEEISLILRANGITCIKPA